MEKDPVCGMDVADTANAESCEHKGKTYYFCSNLCKIQFEQNPEKYIKKEDADDHAQHHH
ncbi:MAG: YHS domain-containing protein [Ignavibacteria bacterium]|nr:MAG: YHS domain-containing protein [Ignavibacteria bacterium]